MFYFKRNGTSVAIFFQLIRCKSRLGVAHSGRFSTGLNNFLSLVVDLRGAVPVHVSGDYLTLWTTRGPYYKISILISDQLTIMFCRI